MEQRERLPRSSTSAPEQLPGVIRGFVWPTEFLMFSDFLVATQHSHSALQLVVGMAGPTRVKLSGTWRDLPGVLIDTDVPHELNATGRLTAIGWIESEGTLGQQLHEQVLDGRPWAVLDQDAVTRIGGSWRLSMDRSVSCEEGHRRWRAGLAELTGAALPNTAVDRRIQAVVDHLRSTPSPPPKVEDLIEVAHLSESRLQHLFREQVGVPIRRYLLWHRILTAMSLLAEGASVTDAAHAAGFADGAHLTRTTHRMNGITPSELGPVGLWLSNCRDHRSTGGRE